MYHRALLGSSFSLLDGKKEGLDWLPSMPSFTPGQDKEGTVES